jgi:hypothetical protein
MAAEKKKKTTGYDKYVNWKIFIIPVALLFVILLMPTPYGMKDVGTEYKLGPQTVVNYITQRLFNTFSSDSEQWQLITAQVMERNMRMGALSKKSFLKRNLNWAKNYDIPVDHKNFEKTYTYIKEKVTEEKPGISKSPLPWQPLW